MKVDSMNSERLKILLAQNGIFVALVLLIGVFSVLRPNFLSFGNGQSILLQAAELGLIAVPVAFLIMSGTIDLSVGSIASAAAVSGGIVMSETQSVTLGLLAGLVTGFLAGGLNGLLVSYLGLNSFVVTLGALSVWGGYALLVSGGTTIPRSELPEAFRATGTMRIGFVPIQILLLVLVVLAGWYVLNHTRFGKEVKAIGGNERAAQLMGVNVKRTRATLFVASGLFSALAGLLLSAKVQSANPNIGSGLELEALTVVLLGGVAFQGGVGRISGVVAGLLFFRVLRTGLVFMQASPFLQTILVGATLILAVALDNSVQSVVRNSWAKLGRQAIEEQSGARSGVGDPQGPGAVSSAAQSREPSYDDVVHVDVSNHAAVPISVTSHFHFFEVNPRLSFDRTAAYGRHLASPAGTAQRFEPGETVRVPLTPIRGNRVVIGFAGLVDGPLDAPGAKEAALDRARACGYLDKGAS